MTLTDVSVMALILAGLAVIRFGIPMLVMWLLKMGCCRILKLTVR